MKKYCVGIDIGGTTVKCGLFTTDGELLKKWEVVTRKEENGHHILSDVAKELKVVLNNEGITKDEVEGIGMGIPGPVLPDGSVEICVNLGWKDANPCKEMSELMDGIACKASNDANVAALGEMWKGGGRGYKNLVCVTLGTGVGGGVIMNGEIVNGSHGCAGEIGHMHVNDQETDYCNCGGRGCLEQVGSATGIVKLAHKNLEDPILPSTMEEFGDALTAKDVVDCAKKGDICAIDTIDTCSKYLGIALATLTYTVDPEVFVIGGGVSKAGSWLIEQIEKYYHHNSSLTKHKAEIKLAELGNDAGIYGSARLVLTK